jgi:hypothetical protein
MTCEHLPCRHCARFIPDASLKANTDGPGHCEGFDRPAHSTDRPCVLFNEQGAWETRKAQMPSTAGQRPKPKQRDHFARESAPTAAPT